MSSFTEMLVAIAILSSVGLVSTDDVRPMVWSVVCWSPRESPSRRPLFPAVGPHQPKLGTATSASVARPPRVDGDEPTLGDLRGLLHVSAAHSRPWFPSQLPKYEGVPIAQNIRRVARASARATQTQESEVDWVSFFRHRSRREVGGRSAGYGAQNDNRVETHRHGDEIIMNADEHRARIETARRKLASKIAEGAPPNSLLTRAVETATSALLEAWMEGELTLQRFARIAAMPKRKQETLVGFFADLEGDRLDRLIKCLNSHPREGGPILWKEFATDIRWEDFTGIIHYYQLGMRCPLGMGEAIHFDGVDRDVELFLTLFDSKLINADQLTALEGLTARERAQLSVAASARAIACGQLARTRLGGTSSADPLFEDSDFTMLGLVVAARTIKERLAALAADADDAETAECLPGGSGC